MSSRVARMAFVTCMDPRIRISEVLGERAINSFVLRNAGGRVTDDVVRGLILCTRLLEVTEIAVVHHTDCRLQDFTDEQLTTKTGADIDFMAFSDPEESILGDVKRLQENELLTEHTHIWGGLYEVATHSLSVVIDIPVAARGDNFTPDQDDEMRY
jgi:carbonic anhydrase